MVSCPAQPRPRLASVTPNCTTESSRPGLASRLRAACAPPLPSSASSRSRDGRTEISATSEAANKRVGAKDEGQRQKAVAVVGFFHLHRRIKYNCEVPLRRILRYLNFAIAAALVVLLLAPIGMPGGRSRRPRGGFMRRSTAGPSFHRDALGVPHILAANQPDALFLQGLRDGAGPAVPNGRGAAHGRRRTAPKWSGRPRWPPTVKPAVCVWPGSPKLTPTAFPPRTGPRWRPMRAA